MPKPHGNTRQFCRNGHNTFICGRYPSGTCRLCQRSYNFNNRRHGLHDGNVISFRVRRLFSGRPAAVAAYRLRYGVSLRSAERAARILFTEHWLSVDVADRWCVAGGEHLAVIYPELYVGAA